MIPPTTRGKQQSDREKGVITVLPGRPFLSSRLFMCMCVCVLLFLVHLHVTVPLSTRRRHTLMLLRQLWANGRAHYLVTWYTPGKLACGQAIADLPTYGSRLFALGKAYAFSDSVRLTRHACVHIFFSFYTGSNNLFSP